MSWVEDHPWKMAIIVSLVVTFLAALDYSLSVYTNDWRAFFSWAPLIWGAVFLVPSVNFLSEKINTKGLKRRET